MPPTKDKKRQAEARAAYRRAGTVRGAAEILGYSSSSWTHKLLRDAGVDTSKRTTRGGR